MLDLPIGKRLPRWKRLGDPIGEELDCIWVELVSRQRWHARHAVTLNPIQRHGMNWVSRNDEFVLRIAPIISQEAIDHVGRIGGRGRPRIPITKSSAAGLMTLDAI